MGTSTTALKNRRNPSAGSYTICDDEMDKVTRDLACIDKARNAKLPRTQLEHIMVLQFVFKSMAMDRLTLSEAVQDASTFFRWRRMHIHTIVREYLNRADVSILQPHVPPAIKRGRGSAAFKEKYGDQFKKLKKHHAVEVLKYVRLANEERGGMVTARRIQAHLFDKFGIEFNQGTIYYCLNKRLKLKYASAEKAKIVFTAARTRCAMQFCINYDESLKLEAAGTHICVYMDESYCRGNHMSKRTWNETGRFVNRVRSKGSLLIIVHAITVDGFLLRSGPLRVPVDEWTTGAHPTAEMCFRSKFAVKHHIKDYHDTMDGEFFLYWVKKRLTPAFNARYPGKKMILILDNAPYHHSMVSEGFRPDAMSKDDIVERLSRLRNKRRVPKLKTIKIKPYADNPPPRRLPRPTSAPDSWAGFIFVDDGGCLWSVDGINDEGYGDVVVYFRVGQVKAGAVESTMVEDFAARLVHAEHKHRWYFLGDGPACMRFARSEGVLTNNKVKRNLRRSERAINELRRRCKDYCVGEKRVEFTFRKADFAKRYNGNGFRGTGGPKTEWLRCAVNSYIKTHYPELQDTMLKSFFRTKEGWRLVFTVPYWASSQPIEQVWAYVKNYVALRYFVGRTMGQLRSQVLCGMYGVEMAGEVSKCWTEGRGHKVHSGLTPALAVKFINHSKKAINDFVSKNRYLSHMGRVGEWRQEDIDRLVLPTSGAMEEDELNDLEEAEDDVLEGDFMNIE